MVTIGVDPHKETHSAVATDELGGELSKYTEAAVQEGFGLLPGLGQGPRPGPSLGARGLPARVRAVRAVPH